MSKVIVKGHMVGNSEDSFSRDVAHFFSTKSFEPRREKTNILVSDPVRHKPGCTATEGGKRLKILNLDSRGSYYLCSENKGADQLRGNFAVTAKLIGIFVFAYAKCWFSHDMANSNLYNEQLWKSIEDYQYHLYINSSKKVKPHISFRHRHNVKFSKFS